jgi:penicillin-binding protein 2
MATMMATVANGGTLYKPWFVRRVESLDGVALREYGPEQVRTITFKQGTLDQVRGALADVVASPEGTGGAARSPTVKIAGKTARPRSPR